MTQGSVAAVDLGASSGRVIVGRVGPNDLEIREIHRFPNEPVGVADGLHWDVLRLHREIVAGLTEAGRADPDIVSVGVDAWGVDFALLDGAGALLGIPYHYRDGRTARTIEPIHAVVPAERLYRRTGTQFMPINSVYQLAAARTAGQLEGARKLLLMPDLFGYWLAGGDGVEETNASTTGLYDIKGHGWASDVIELVGLPWRIFPALHSPGTIVGPLRDTVKAETGLAAAVLTLVGSHDTASAVAAVPVDDDRFAYIASGTWSLVGVELDGPVLTDDSRAANFTNELGVDGRIRYLRNVMGLWLLQESMRSWHLAESPRNLAAMLKAAAELPTGGPVIDPDDPVLLAPGDMPDRIVAICRQTDQPPPRSRPQVVRCILDSLADAYARALRDAIRLSKRKVKVVHVVGGGSRNELLCQLTADAIGLPVLAGPVEATALGNVLVQARAHGMVDGDLDDLRALVRRTHEVRTYRPARDPVPRALARAGG